MYTVDNYIALAFEGSIYGVQGCNSEGMKAISDWVNSI